jgi:hypothetical protein
MPLKTAPPGAKSTPRICPPKTETTGLSAACGVGYERATMNAAVAITTMRAATLFDAERCVFIIPRVV